MDAYGSVYLDNECNLCWVCYLYPFISIYIYLYLLSTIYFIDIRWWIDYYRLHLVVNDVKLLIHGLWRDNRIGELNYRNPTLFLYLFIYSVKLVNWLVYWKVNIHNYQIPISSTQNQVNTLSILTLQYY